MNNFIKQRKEITYLPVAKIIPNPYQSRKKFNQSALYDLTESIKIYGVLEPIYVRYINGIYEVIAGERRLLASKRAGFLEIPCIILNMSDKDTAFISLIKNVQVDNLNIFEEAEGYQNLMVDFGYTQEEIAKMVGKKKSTISNKMSILKLPKDIKETIIQHNLSEKHAIALLKLKYYSTQKEVLEKIIKYDLNIIKTEKLIDETIKRISGTSVKNKQKIKAYFNDMKIFTNTIKGAVNTMKDSGIPANFSVNKIDDGYEINIKLCM